jgi:hypothetical protein
MLDDGISVIDVAAQLGARKQYIFKILRRLGIEPSRSRSQTNRGQRISYITSDEFGRVRAELESRRPAGATRSAATEAGFTQPAVETGVFYLLLLEPEHDPCRFKVGFAQSLDERLRALRCAAPLLTVIKTWPCKLLWEKTAIECVTQGCQRLHTEVFRTTNIDEVVSRCNQFFGVMPEVRSRR